MKAIVIGGEGTIGGPVADALSARHEVVRVGRNSGDYRADIASTDSIVRLFEAVARKSVAAKVRRVKDVGRLEDPVGVSAGRTHTQLRRRGVGRVPDSPPAPE